MNLYNYLILGIYYMTITAYYFDGTIDKPAKFYLYNGTTDVEIHQATYFNGTADITIGTAGAQNSMVAGNWDFNLTNGTNMSSYGFGGGADFIVNNNAVYVASGKGWYGTALTYTPPAAYTNISFGLLSTGWGGSVLAGMYGGDLRLDIYPTNVQLRIAGAWIGQYNVDNATTNHTYKLSVEAGIAKVYVDNTVVISSAYSAMNTGLIYVACTPGSDVTTLGLDWLQYA